MAAACYRASRQTCVLSAAAADTADSFPRCVWFCGRLSGQWGLTNASPRADEALHPGQRSGHGGLFSSPLALPRPQRARPASEAPGSEEASGHHPFNSQALFSRNVVGFAEVCTFPRQQQRSSHQSEGEAMTANGNALNAT